MKIYEIGSEKGLTKILDALHSKRGSIFRGQENKDFYLQPGLFRENDSDKIFKKFSTLTSCLKWVPNDNALKILNHLGINLDSNEIKAIRMLTLYVMMYNYEMAKFLECSRNYNHIVFDRKTIDYYREKNVEYWTSEKTFQRGFSENLDTAQECIALDGAKILKPGVIYNVLTKADQALPQHYGLKTAALDWTFDPYIAIFFAIHKLNIINVQSTGYFSIYAYSEIDCSENSPIIIAHGLEETRNPRIIAQKGCFTYFTQACSFYYLSGRWPCVEDYAITDIYQDKFKLTKVNIPTKFVGYFKNILLERGINSEALCLDAHLDIDENEIYS